MKVYDVMTENVVSCRPETNLAEAISLMWRADCGVLPVTIEGKLVGVITDRDIAIALGTNQKLASQMLVREVMSKSLFACNLDEDIHAALKLMRKDKVRRLPVLDHKGFLRGIVSMNDITLHAEKFDGHKTTDLSYEDVISTYKAICEHRHPKAAKAPLAATAAVARN